MTDLTHIFSESIHKQLFQKGVEVVRILPFLLQGDQADKLKVLQDLLADLEEPHLIGTQEYIIQIRPSIPTLQPALKHETHSHSKPTQDGIYLTSGKLNIPFLMKNADLLFDAGDYSLARKIYKTILQSGEYTATVLFRIGRCYESESKLEEACGKYEEALVFHPTLECYQRLSTLLIRMNKNHQAADMMERAQVLQDSLSDGGSSSYHRGLAGLNRSMTKLRNHG